MKLFQMLAEWMRAHRLLAKKYGTDIELPDFSQQEKINCTHSAASHKLMVNLLGYHCELSNSPMCLECTEKYLNAYSTVCASCKRPILPGMEVAMAWQGAFYPLTHAKVECCSNEDLICGRLGEGRLITLSELSLMGCHGKKVSFFKNPDSQN